MKCEYCGRVLKPGEYSCPGCGATVENQELVYNNTSTQEAKSSEAKIEVKVGGVNISIDNTTSNIGIQTPPPVRQTPPSLVGAPTYIKAEANVQNGSVQKVRYGAFL